MNYVAPYKGLQGATVHKSSHSQEHRGTPLLVLISALGSFTCEHNTWDQRLYVPSEK